MNMTICVIISNLKSNAQKQKYLNKYTPGTPTIPAATADMSVADYMNYYASAVSDYSAVATRKDASLKLWRLPWTCSNTVVTRRPPTAASLSQSSS